MKIKFAAVAIVLLSLLALTCITGCSGKTPEQTVARFSNDVQDGHIGDIARSMTINYRDKMTAEFIQFDEWIPLPEDEDVKFTADQFESQVSTSTAKVWHPDMAYVKWILIKENGHWKIDNMDVDTAAMQEAQDEVDDD